MKANNGLQELKTKVKDSLRKKYPSLPDHALTIPRYSDTTANSLTKAILDYLKVSNHKAWRQSSEGRYRPGQTLVDVIGRTRVMKGQYLPGTNEGHADVQSIINGLFVAWEVKMKDKQSDKQKQFQQEVEQSGGKYFICRSFDEFITQYKQLTNNNQ